MPVNSDFVLIREKRDPLTDMSVIRLRRRNSVDLTSYTFFRTENNVDEYVHPDDLEHFQTNL